jgi:carbon-monoxide dehydrogenase medium subunit
MALRLARPAHLVDINGVRDLERIAVEGDALVIGACMRHAAFDRPVPNGLLGPLLSKVAHHIAHYPIRTRGTFGGSLAHADPASEWCLVAVTLDAQIEARSVGGTRAIPAGNFFAGAMMTALKADELLTKVSISLFAPDTRWGFSEYSRRSGDFALGMALATYQLRNGKITEPRLGIGGIENVPRRIADAEAVLDGKRPGREAFLAAADAVAGAMQPLNDIRYPAHYRRDLARAMALRALESAST